MAEKTAVDLKKQREAAIDLTVSVRTTVAMLCGLGHERLARTLLNYVEKLENALGAKPEEESAKS